MALSPNAKGVRRPASHMSLKNHRSSASLRPQDDGGHDDGGPVVSLAHELAAALMPEPSMTSRLLADEFGLEFDDGVEGGVEGDDNGEANGATEPHSVDERELEQDPELGQAGDPFMTANGFAHDEPVLQEPDEDTLERLTKDLAATDAFLGTLRRLDADGDSSSNQHRTTGHARQGSVIIPSEGSTLEGVAAAMIRRLNDTTREREGQVRELRDCDREFHKIAAEVGGMDVLAEVDILAVVDGLELPSGRPVHTRQDSLNTRLRLDDLREEEEPVQELELLEPDEDDEYAPSPTLKRRHTDIEPPPPPPASNAPASVTRALPELVYMRSLTGSLVASLSAVSEHAQVGSAGAADAGRKLRALRNRLGTWRAELESAERSAARIEQWEASVARRKLSARGLVQAELSAFERVLADANNKTQAIRSHPVIAAS
ncbi:hypothetical protein AURDEDRAFT_114567 [Auricularia subglabra TFB-10046 SS5]|nr:hypothetical protein AURDEDRAFT_114567 [Auricularia subglabra TFB-10046 SS5]